MRVWISCNNRTSSLTRQKLRRFAAGASGPNPRWVITAVDALGVVDAEIAKPLTSVLAVDNWQSPLIDFVCYAIENLQAVEILDALFSIGTNGCQ